MAAHRVVSRYTRQYADPIAVRAGEPITPGKEDHEYPGWIWCTDARGRSGWVPLAIVDRDAGVARRDYSALELSVEPGELVTVEEEESGWALCRNATGSRGWVPCASLTATSDAADDNCAQG